MKRFTFARFYQVGDPPGGVLPPPTPTPALDPPDPPRAGRLQCEGCGCVLDSQGKIIRRGDGLKAHLDREDEVKTLRKDLDDANALVTELRSQVSALTPKPKRNILF